MKKITKNVKKIILLFIGLFLLALGIVFIIKANIGSDSITILYQGLSHFLKTNIAAGTIIANLLYVVILAVIDHKKLGLATIASLVFLGSFIAIIEDFNFIVDLQPTNSFYQILLLFVGMIVAGLGIGIYVFSDTGYSSFDGVIMAVAEKTNKSYGTIKIVNDVILFIIGYLLGGNFGYGSLITIFLYGPIINFFINLFKKNLSK